jgi:hypothetical protein
MIFGEEGNDSMMVETNLWAETEIGVAWPWEQSIYQLVDLRQCILCL